MKKGILFLLLPVLVGCAHASLVKTGQHQFTISCNNCSESEWREAAGRYCTSRPIAMGSRKGQVVRGLTSGKFRYRPLKIKTYRCTGHVVSE